MSILGIPFTLNVLYTKYTVDLRMLSSLHNVVEDAGL